MSKTKKLQVLLKLSSSNFFFFNFRFSFWPYLWGLRPLPMLKTKKNTIALTSEIHRRIDYLSHPPLSYKCEIIVIPKKIKIKIKLNK